MLYFMNRYRVTYLQSRFGQTSSPTAGAAGAHTSKSPQHVVQKYDAVCIFIVYNDDHYHLHLIICCRALTVTYLNPTSTLSVLCSQNVHRINVYPC